MVVDHQNRTHSVQPVLVLPSVSFSRLDLESKSPNQDTRAAESERIAKPVRKMGAGQTPT